jgi:hypothetical protein
MPIGTGNKYTVLLPVSIMSKEAKPRRIFKEKLIFWNPAIFI